MMHYRRALRDCPVCGITDSALFVSWPSNPSYAPYMTCTNCGDTWSDGELMGRPLRRGWRQEAIGKAVDFWEQACECPLRRDAALYIQPCKHEHPGFPAGHGYTPTTGPFAPGEGCRVMLARYPCNYRRDQHDPELPPEDLDVFGYRRQRGRDQ